MRKNSLNKNVFYALAMVMALASLFTACKPDGPDDPNEEEVITKVQLSFTDSSNSSNTFTVLYSDPDGDGGAGPTRHDTIRLDSGKVYNVAVALFDESDPQNIDNITTEVQSEGADHLFCYTASGVSVSVLRTDSDGTFPIGITSKWTVGGPGDGSLRVELRHQPGVKDGTCAPGATDVLVDFHLIVD